MLNNNNNIPGSVLQTAPLEGMSPKYKFVNSMELINTLNLNGWNVVTAKSKKTRDIKKIPFSKHMIELEHPEHSLISGNEEKLRLLVTNAHDGTSSVVIRLGILRLICGNGLVVSKGTVGEYRIRHVGLCEDRVKSVLTSLVNAAPKAVQTINSMKRVELTEDQALELAFNSAKIKYGEMIPIDPRQLLVVRRKEDQSPTLWNTYNKIQEHLIKGGVPHLDQSKRRSSSRSIRSIDQQIKVNTGLWDLAVNYIK